MGSITKAELAVQVEALRRSLDQERAKSARLEETLTETLEQQAATGEILRVIGSSPADLQSVLDAITANAARLCECGDVIITRVEGKLLRTVAGLGPFHTAFGLDFTVPIVRGSVVGRAVVDRTVLHIHDLAAESDEEFPIGKALQRRFGHRTMLAAPLLREGRALGVIALFRTEVRPFSDKQIELLKTFADQAVIAIENVRLFKEVEARNSDPTEALDQQSATGEILRVISSSPTDVQPVFDAVVRSAARLCDAAFSAVTRFDGGLLHLVATNNMSQAETEAYHSLFPRQPLRSFIVGRAFLDGRTVHVEDIEADPDYDPRTRGVLDPSRRSVSAA